MSEKGGSEIRPVVFLTVVVFIAVFCLTVTDMVTRDLIEEAKEEETKEALEELFPEMDSFDYDGGTEIYTIVQGGETAGYAFTAIGSGYGGDIEIMVGMESDRETIKGIVVKSHSETPGLGAKITEEDFQGRFEGKTIEEIRLTKDGGKIDAISGATISSNAVVDAVRTTATEKMALLEGGE